MESMRVLSAILLIIIPLLIIWRAQRDHKGWLSAWNELARCAKVVDQQGRFVSAENFHGDYRGLAVELRIITKHIDPIGDWNTFTRMTVHMKRKLGDNASFVEKSLGKSQFFPLSGRVINVEGYIKSHPKDFFAGIFSHPQLKRWLIESNFSQLEYHENQIDLYFQGIVTDVARLHAGLILLYKLAEHIIESETIQEGDICTESS